MNFWIGLPTTGRPRVTIQKLRTPPYSPDLALRRLQAVPLYGFALTPSMKSSET